MEDWATVAHAVQQKDSGIAAAEDVVAVSAAAAAAVVVEYMDWSAVAELMFFSVVECMDFASEVVVVVEAAGVVEHDDRCADCLRLGLRDKHPHLLS